MSFSSMQQIYCIFLSKTIDIENDVEKLQLIYDSWLFFNTFYVEISREMHVFPTVRGFLLGHGWLLWLVLVKMSYSHEHSSYY